MKMLPLILRCAVGLLFLYAGGVKITDTQQFAYAIQNYRLLPWTASIVLAVYLPWLEVVCALALISGRLYLGALAALAGMTVMFMGALGSAWARGLDVACGCFGLESNSTNYPLHLGGNALVLAALAYLAFAQRRPALTSERAATIPL